MTLRLISLSALLFAFTANAEPVSAIDLSVSHTFSKPQAAERIGYLLEYWEKRYGIKHVWTDFEVSITGRIYGISIQATFKIDDTLVSATARDPGFLWRARVKKYVERKMKKYLDLEYDEPS